MHRVLALVATVLLLTSSVSHAQPQPGDAGVFGDAAGTWSKVTVTTFVPFDLHAVAFGLDAGIQAYELGFEGIPANTFVLLAELLGNPPFQLDDPESTDFIIDIGECVEPAGPVRLVSLNILAVVEIPWDTVVSLRGTQPSSFDASPGYTNCADELVAFTPSPFNDCGSWVAGENRPEGSVVLNPSWSCPLPTDETSMGSMKSRFH